MQTIKTIMGYGFAATGLTAAAITGTWGTQSAYTYYKTYKAEKDLIKWSPSGNDFVGNVEMSENYNYLRGRTFVSPRGNMEVTVNRYGLTLLNSCDNKVERKELYDDGNTFSYRSDDIGMDPIYVSRDGQEYPKKDYHERNKYSYRMMPINYS